MPKVTKTEIKVPPKLKPVTAGYDGGWDLREVDSSFLVAELVRRGECPTLQPAGRSNVVPAKPVKPSKKPSLFG